MMSAIPLDITEKWLEMIELEQDMKDIEAELEKKGYKMVRYDEFEHEANDEVAQRYLLVFEKAK